MNERIVSSLTRQLDRHRIVFWYDAKKELRSEFKALEMDGVEKIVRQRSDQPNWLNCKKKHPQKAVSAHIDSSSDWNRLQER